MKNFLLTGLFILIFSGCSAVEVSTDEDFPDNSDGSVTISLFGLKNYTDTPQAGMRAANIIEGVLLAKGYKVVTNISDAYRNATLEEQIAFADKKGTRYLMTGGVSEWRYKTGIDGEPAVSLQCKLIEVSSGDVVWSATGADNSWGRASIGTVAQELIESLL